MLAQQRYEKIMSKIEQNGSVTVNEIARELSVSIETVRRDFVLLETHGKLKRVFGGAVASDRPNQLRSLERRLDSNIENKLELSRYAATFIVVGDTIAIDSGSTAIELANVLKSTFSDLTIITCSNTVFNILKEKFKVVLVGGEYVGADDCFGGSLTESFLKIFHFTKAFISPSAISVKNGLETFLAETMALQRILISNSEKTFVLADSEKFTSRATYKMCDLDPEFIYVTDSRVSEETKAEFAENGFLLVYEEQ